MIYIFSALYCEARIFIEQFHLKKLMHNTRFQQFRDENAHILLTITGVGEIAAAVAASSVCTEYKPKQDDFLLNAGVCAGPPDRQGIFLMHKLVEQATGKTFYPDILYRHTFQEAALTTGMVPKDGGAGKAACLAGMVPKDGGAGKAAADACFYDMEAAAIYQAGSYFFGPHQMLFLKIVSDSGEGDRLAQEVVGQLFQAYKDRIFAFLGQLLQIGQAGIPYGNLPGMQAQEEMETWLAQLCQDMHASKAMGDLLRQHIRYAMLTGTDYKAIVKGMYQEGSLPCKNKREGKLCFENLRQRLF